MITGGTSSTSLIARVTACGALTLPAASVAITEKLYSDAESKSGSAIKVTSPDTLSMLNGESDVIESLSKDRSYI